MLTPSIAGKFLEIISDYLGKTVKIKNSTPVSGGSINDAFKVETDDGTFFLKYNRADRFPGMFESEAKGLELLRSAGEICIPKVIGTSVDNHHNGLIVLEYIETGNPSPGYWELFGTQLARLHRHSNEKFGLDHNNYIGSLPQNNAWRLTWPDFFIEERLEPQLKLARDDGKIISSHTRRFEILYPKLEHVFPAEPPALIHGDLWSGNYMIGLNGQPCIMDPAVYFGHREMDIAMSKLFGGFNAGFYRSYNAEYPLEEEWEIRVNICNLYPLLVHVNLFGGTYLSQIESIIKIFT